MKHHQYPEERKQADWERRLRRMGYVVDYHACNYMADSGVVDCADAEDGVSGMESEGGEASIN